MLKTRRVGLAAGSLLLIIVACVAAIVLSQHHEASGHALIPVATVSASVADAGSTISGVQLLACTGDQPARAPTSVNLTCGDGSVTYVNVIWQTWAADKAIGTGTLRENSCDPNCAVGKPASEPATITLTGPQNINGAMLFTTMTVTPEAPNPHNFQPMTATVPQ